MGKVLELKDSLKVKDVHGNGKQLTLERTMVLSQIIACMSNFVYVLVSHNHVSFSTSLSVKLRVVSEHTHAVLQTPVALEIV